MLVKYFCVFYVLAAVYTDIKVRKIFNQQILIGLLVGLLFTSLPFFKITLIGWLCGLTFGLVCMLPLYVIRAVGAGDVKLIMVLSGFIGVNTSIKLMLYMFLFGGLLALVVVLKKGMFFRFIKNIRLMGSNLFYKTQFKVDLELFDQRQLSVGAIPYVPAIGLSFFYLLATHQINF